MAKSCTERILSLVDVVGSAERLKQYRNTIDKTLPGSCGNKGRYWMMYAKIAQQFIADPKVSDKQSVLSCMFNAVKLGLNPDPVFGEIYFIPYSGKLTYQIGYKGMIKLSINSGYVVDVRSDRVFEKDTWEFYEDEKGQHYKFIPNFLMGKDRGRELFVYSVFQKKDGTCSCHIMESHHVDEIKKMSLARTPRSPWSNNLYEPEMRKKTCIRRHWKNQPKSADIAFAIEHEEALERGEFLKQEHPEIEGIIDSMVENSQQGEEDKVLSVFDEPAKKPMQYGD